MGGSPNPKPSSDGVVMLYENVKVAITNGFVRIFIPNKKTVVISQKTGAVKREK